MNLVDFTNRFEQAKNESEFNQAISDFAGVMGFQQYRFALLVPEALARPRVVIFSRCNQQWVERYNKDRMIAKDPIVFLAQSRVIPIHWRDIKFEKKLPCGALDVMEQARECGLCDGVSFPLHGAGGESGILSFISDTVHSDAKTITPILRYIADYILDAGIRLVNSVDNDIALTHQEMNCLFWSSEGKTAGEIGAMLCLSVRMVNLNIQSAIRKTDSDDLHQAISKVATTGLLHLDLTLSKVDDYIL